MRETQFERYLGRVNLDNLNGRYVPYRPYRHVPHTAKPKVFTEKDMRLIRLGSKQWNLLYHLDEMPDGSRERQHAIKRIVSLTERIRRLEQPESEDMGRFISLEYYRFYKSFVLDKSASAAKRIYVEKLEAKK